MRCQVCGNEVQKEYSQCPNCGAKLGVTPQGNPQATDNPSTDLNILGFLFPIVGLIMYLVMKSTMPIRAKGIGKWSLIGFGAGVLVTFLMWGAFFGLIASMM